MRPVAGGATLLALGALVLGGGAVAPSVVQGAETVRGNVFPGPQVLPLMVAREKGIFERRNIKLELSFTRSSQEQMTGVRDGKWDVGSTGIDNVIAYNMNEETDFFMFMGVGGTTIHFFVDPSVASFNDLRGKPLGVDALTTGYAFVLREMALVPTFRLPTLIHTRSGNAKYLNELSHVNPVWIHPSDARRLGVATGDLLKVRTEIGTAAG